MDLLRGCLYVEREEHRIRLLREGREKAKQEISSSSSRNERGACFPKAALLPLCFLASCYYSASHIRALLRLLYALSGRSLLPRTHTTYIGLAQLAEIQRTRRCRIDLMAEEACFVL
mgnify:CR=1 FL=1